MILYVGAYSAGKAEKRGSTLPLPHQTAIGSCGVNLLSQSLPISSGGGGRTKPGDPHI